MDKEEPKAWDKAKLEEWKKFWDSEMGQEALKKMEFLKNDILERALAPAQTEAVTYYVGRAAGVDLVIQDIKAGFDALKELEKEENKKAKK